MHTYIYYASQTGTSELLSQRLGQHIYERTDKSHRIEVQSIEQLDVPTLYELSARKDAVMLFLVSTTGQGAVTSSMRKFWHDLLIVELPPLDIECPLWSILGVGDSSYKCFNYAARKLHQRLKQLGAPIALHMADEQDPNGLGTGFNDWVQSIQDALHLSRQPIRKVDISKYNVLSLPSATAGCLPHRGQYKAIVVANVRLTPTDHFQDTRHLRLATAHRDLTPGQVAVIYPRNTHAAVGEIIEHFAWDADLMLTVETKYSFSPAPSMKASVRWLLTNFVDLNTPPSQPIFAFLAHFASGAVSEKLAELSTDYDLWLEYCQRPRRRPIEVLRDFAEVTKGITACHLIDVFGPMKPRSFSLAGITSTGVELLIAIVRYESKHLNSSVYPQRVGLFSSFLEELGPGQELSFDIVDSDIIFDKSAHPLLLIGAGTGMAPLRCITQASPPHRDITLIYGCRDRLRDFYFQGDFVQARVFLAESRASSQPRQYVQDIIRQHSVLVQDLVVSKNATIVLSGNTKLPEAVKEALIDTLSPVVEDAKKYVETMVKAKRLQMECW